MYYLTKVIIYKIEKNERRKRKRKEDQGDGKEHLRDETESNRKQERGHCSG